MRLSASEKQEIIRLVEGSDLPVKLTLEQLDVPRSTFYDWYARYREKGFNYQLGLFRFGLASTSRCGIGKYS